MALSAFFLGMANSYWQFASELLFELQLSNPTRGQLVPAVGTAPPGESVPTA